MNDNKLGGKVAIATGGGVSSGDGMERQPAAPQRVRRVWCSSWGRVSARRAVFGILAALLTGLGASGAAAKTLTIAAPGDTVEALYFTQMVKSAQLGDVVVGDSIVVVGQVDLAADSIYCALRVNNSQFLGAVSAAKTYFFQRVDFKRSSFGQVDFNGAHCMQSVIFESSNFADVAKLRIYTAHHLVVSRARFDSTANFLALLVEKNAIFIGTHFAGNAIFSQGRFKGEAIFVDAVFAGPTDFTYAIIDGKAEFERTTFRGRVDLREAAFLRQADFKGARFGGELISTQMFFNTLFLDNWSQIKDAIRIASDVSSAEHWVRRPEEIDDIQAVSRLYIQLQEVLRQNGLYADENNCYYDLKAIEGRHYWRQASLNPATWIEPLKYAILWATCGYGVRPQYTFYLGGMIVLLCSLCYYQPGAISERGADGVIANRLKTRKKRFRNAFYFSLNTFTTVGYGDWYPTDNVMKLGNMRLVHFRSIAMLEGLAGWVLITVFVISLGKTWIR